MGRGVTLFRNHWYMLGACLLCVAAYVRGLHGDFLFDDFPNIVFNPALQAITQGTTDWLNIAFLSGSGVLRRPISMLSFGLNVRAFGMDPFSFKVVNLAIHLVNGVLLYGLLRRVFDRFTLPDLPQPSSCTRMLAILAASAWLLHPLQVSSVLYIVQRMNLLSSMFMLGGLLVYVEARARMLQGRRHLLVALAGLCAGGGLAVLCKENGALIVAYALLIEVICFRFAGTLSERRAMKGFFWLTVGLPLAFVCLHFGMHPEALAYSRNGFTLYTRLLSEARVLCDYLTWTFLPLPSSMGMYHDDIALSSGLLSPPSTAISLAFLLGLTVAAWILRRRIPALAFGVGWFLIGHSMESTILPLELVFEHRNYLPIAGVLSATWWLLGMKARQKISDRLSLVGGIALIALLTGVTSVRAKTWGSSLSLALSDVSHHPLSSRSQYEAGRSIALEGARNGNLAAVTGEAESFLRRAAELDPRQVFPGVSLILLRGKSAPATPVEIVDLSNRLRNAASNEQANPFLDLLVSASKQELSLSHDQVAQLVEAALANPRWRPQVRAMMLNDYGAYLFNVVHDNQAAISLTAAASVEDNTNPYFEINLSKLALALGNADEARKHLEIAQQRNGAGLYDRDISQIRKMLHP